MPLRCSSQIDDNAADSARAANENVAEGTGEVPVERILNAFPDVLVGLSVRHEWGVEDDETGVGKVFAVRFL